MADKVSKLAVPPSSSRGSIPIDLMLKLHKMTGDITEDSSICFYSLWFIMLSQEQ